MTEWVKHYLFPPNPHFHLLPHPHPHTLNPWSLVTGYLPIIPDNDFLKSFHPTFLLHLTPSLRIFSRPQPLAPLFPPLQRISLTRLLPSLHNQQTSLTDISASFTNLFSFLPEDHSLKINNPTLLFSSPHFPSLPLPARFSLLNSQHTSLLLPNCVPLTPIETRFYASLQFLLNSTNKCTPQRTPLTCS